MSGRTDAYLLFITTWGPKDADQATRQRFVSQLEQVIREENAAAWTAAEKFRGLVVEAKELMQRTEPILVEVETRLVGHADPDLDALGQRVHALLGWKEE